MSLWIILPFTRSQRQDVPFENYAKVLWNDVTVTVTSNLIYGFYDSYDSYVNPAIVNTSGFFW